MNIREIYDQKVRDIEFDLLTEAVKFGSKQLQLLKQYDRRFKFGVEYEFHLDREVVGTVPTDAEEFEYEARQNVEDDVIDEIKDHFDDLVAFLFEFSTIFDTKTEYNDAIEDASSGSFEMWNELVDILKHPVTINQLRDIIKNRHIAEVFPNERSEIIDLAKLIPNLQKNEFLPAITSVHLDSLFEMVEYVEDSSNNRIMMDKLIQFIINERDPEWYYEQIDERVRIEADRIASQQTYGYEEEYVRAATDMLEDSPVWSLIESIEEDSSVAEGVEVVSKPLSLQNTITLMKYMFDFIKKNGYTSDKTGLHINISMREFKDTDIDPLKVMTLMDSDFFQNNIPVTNEGKKTVDKWRERNNMVVPNTNAVSGIQIERMAKAYIAGGTSALEDEARRVLAAPEKFRGVNWSHILNNYNKSTRRIEFRFFGGKGYENRFNDILQDLMYISYVILASLKGAHTQDHLKGLVRMLSRISKRTHNGKTFDQLVNEMRATTPREPEQQELFTTYSGGLTV